MTDLVVAAGRTTTLTGDQHVAGWVEVSGQLVVEGDLVCLGVSVEPGGQLRCRSLVTNLLELDCLGNPAHVAAEVRARVACLVQVTGTLADRVGDWTIDYIHHYAGDLNPSFDYERGDRVIRDAYVEGDQLPLAIDVDAIRRALQAGTNPFTLPPIVTIEAPAKTEAVVDPLATELAAWIAAHPGPQRALFDQLRDSWTGRLTGGGAAIARVLKKAVGSPKLAAERDAWIATLALVAAAPAVGAPRLAIRSDPPKRADAWLDRIPLDADAIDAVGQRIAELPDRIGRYTRATRIQLSYNKLARLPPALFGLPIETLDLRGNQLTALADDIGRLAGLRHLTLEDNPLAVLPDALCGLAGLEQLSLQGTPLTRLPERFGELRALTYLSLQGCQKLTTLPESFFALDRLTTLNLHYTRLPGAILARLRTTFPASVFGNFFG